DGAAIGSRARVQGTEPIDHPIRRLHGYRRHRGRGRGLRQRAAVARGLGHVRGLGGMVHAARLASPGRQRHRLPLVRFGAGRARALFGRDLLARDRPRGVAADRLLPCDRGGRPAHHAGTQQHARLVPGLGRLLRGRAGGGRPRLPGPGGGHRDRRPRGLRLSGPPAATRGV
ncbi:MAG: hypothetical protein AVDCRST_MAG03-2197, partial [uncultured Rubrobacteraceae bacterium]